MPSYLPQSAYGWSFVISLVVSLWLTRMALAKMRDEQGRPGGCMNAGFTYAVIASMALLFFPFVVILATQVHQFSKLPHYEATVVDVTSEMVEERYEDSDGRSRTRKVMMHTPIVEFMGPTGTLRLPGSVRSGGEPVMGSKMTVVYAPGMQTASEFSFRSVALYGALAVMLGIVGSILLFIYRWASGRSTEKLGDLGMKLVMWGLVPLAMLAMEALMAYALMQHFLGYKELPIWVVGLLGLFVVALGLGIVQMISGIVSQQNQADSSSS